MQFGTILALLLCNIAFNASSAKTETFTLKLTKDMDNSQNSDDTIEEQTQEDRGIHRYPASWPGSRKPSQNQHLSEDVNNTTQNYHHHRHHFFPDTTRFPNGGENLVDFNRSDLMHKSLDKTSTIKLPAINTNHSAHTNTPSTVTTPNPNNITPNSSALYCQPEIFQHVYITTDQDITPMTNSWKRAKVGELATTRYLCLLPNGLPVTRACLFNTNKAHAEWENAAHLQNTSCLQRPRQRIATQDLNQLHEEILNGTYRKRGGPGRRDVLRKVNNFLQSPEYRILPADIHYVGHILRETVQDIKDSALSVDVVNMCSQLMAQDPMVLRVSGNINATNVMLETFERYLDDLVETVVRPDASCSGVSMFGGALNQTSSTQSTIETVDFTGLGVRAHLSENISVFYVNPQCDRITGIVVYDSERNVGKNTAQHFYREAHGDFLYRFIRWDERTEDLLQEPGLQVASFMPLSLWTSVERELSTTGHTPIIVLKVYATDCLFVEQETYINRKPSSEVLSISIPGHSGLFKEPLPFILRNQHYNKAKNVISPAPGSGCGYWNYNSWISSGVQSPQNALNKPLVLCTSLHLTQFSFLVGGSYRQNDPNDSVLITPLHVRVLDIISLVGCSLSLLGLFGIWLTALIFPSWRALATNKVLLNLCFVLTLQLILFVFVNTNDVTQELLEGNHIVDCVILGALMQYTILVLFTWMLIIAFLQFQRYVTVIGIKRPKHYLLKSAIAAWGFPLIPTILVASIDYRTYIPTEYAMLNTGAVCYPSGHGLTFGVILPITLIIIANLTIFIYVFYSISHSLKQATQRSERTMIKQQIRLSILLYFLLGLSWIFGIFAYMQAGIVFSYLFCLTATLQGLVLFVYFVLLDDMTRELWRKLCCSASEARRSAKMAAAHESHSMTASTGLSSREHESEAHRDNVISRIN